MSHIQSSNIDKTQVGVPNNTQTSVNKLTVENDGVYLIHAQCAFVTSSTGYRGVSIKITSKTGVIVNRGNANAVALPSPIPTCIQCQSITAVSLQEGDTVGLYANQNSGSALNVSASYIVIIRLK